MEEGDTDSLQIVDKDGKQEEEAAAASAAEALLPRLPQDKDEEDEENEDHFAKSLSASTQGRPAGAAADIPPYISADAFTGGPIWVDLPKGPPPAIASGYTTLEMFQQATQQGVPVSAPTGGGRPTEEEEAKPRSSYIRQLSANSALSCQL